MITAKPDSSELGRLAASYRSMVTAQGEDGSLEAFCVELLSQEDVAHTVEPLVDLLVNYARSKLEGRG